MSSSLRPCQRFNLLHKPNPKRWVLWVGAPFVQTAVVENVACHEDSQGPGALVAHYTSFAIAIQCWLHEVVGVAGPGGIIGEAEPHGWSGVEWVCVEQLCIVYAQVPGE